MKLKAKSNKKNDQPGGVPKSSYLAFFMPFSLHIIIVKWP